MPPQQPLPAPGRLLVSAAVLAAALAATACLTTHNFKDPSGPRYAGDYGLPPSGETPPATAPLRVVTFNIKMALQVDGALALLRKSEPLRGFDLLMLQEMDSAGTERMARALSVNYVYFPSSIHPWSDREFGTAVLSPWPLSELRKTPLPHAAFGTRVSRAVTSAVITRGALRVRAYAVHLPAGGAVSGEDRKEQVQVILREARTSAEPVVIGGDFNSRSVGPWFRDGGFLWLTEKIPGTARGFGHWWKFDHLFVRGLRPAAGGPSVGVVDPGEASDHRAVWTVLEPEVRPDRMTTRKISPGRHSRIRGPKVPVPLQTISGIPATS